MNHNASHPAATATSAAPVFRESYYMSTIELQRGTTVSEVSLGRLPTQEVLELLRMRSLWPKH